MKAKEIKSGGVSRESLIEHVLDGVGVGTFDGGVAGDIRQG